MWVTRGNSFQWYVTVEGYDGSTFGVEAGVRVVEEVKWTDLDGIVVSSKTFCGNGKA